jgi:predicted amidohydrolase YtcJ
MADADVVITGTVLTVDHARPTAEALAVTDGRIIAVGTRSDVAGFVGANTETIDLGDGCVMPGFIEAHGHPLMEAVVLSDRIVDIRPVTMRGADDVVDAVHREVTYRGPDGAYPERGSRWMPAGSAVATGMRISLHNDPPVTPEEPLRNISVAVTRMAPSGRVLAPEERLTVEQAIRAQTIDAAWHLFADDVVGSLEVGKYADVVVLSADPRAVPPEQIADLEVRATHLAGRQVYSQ